MTSTAMRIQCSCTEAQIATGDLCDFCDHVKCANCGDLPKHPGREICGACLDDAKQAEFDLQDEHSERLREYFDDDEEFRPSFLEIFR